jgi:predicted ArsR family transcriptional regulator
MTAPHVGHRQTQDLSSKLEDVVTAAKTHLTNGVFQELKELLTEYEGIFAGDDEDYGRTNKVYHCIDTGDARQIRQPPRRIPLAKQAEVRELLGDMQRHRVIEESDSPWSSPVVLVRKKNGELRFTWYNMLYLVMTLNYLDE